MLKSLAIAILGVVLILQTFKIAQIEENLSKTTRALSKHVLENMKK